MARPRRCWWYSCCSTRFFTCEEYTLTMFLNRRLLEVHKKSSLITCFHQQSQTVFCKAQKISCNFGRYLEDSFSKWISHSQTHWMLTFLVLHQNKIIKLHGQNFFLHSTFYKINTGPCIPKQQSGPWSWIQFRIYNHQLATKQSARTLKASLAFEKQTLLSAIFLNAQNIKFQWNFN